MSFSACQGVVIGKEIRENRHGARVAGKSVVRGERHCRPNSIHGRRGLQPGSKGAVVGNTLIKNGGAISVQAGAQADLKGNTIASAP